ncbi:MAG: hypothetical protein ACR2I2_19990 [Bryobacteraceae bacterium]
MRPRLQRESDGTVLVRAFTDLKRHVMSDKVFPWFLNERVARLETTAAEISRLHKSRLGP